MKHNQYMKIILFDNGKFRRGKLLVDRASAKKTCLAYIKAQVCKSLFPLSIYQVVIDNKTTSKYRLDRHKANKTLIHE